MTDEGIFVLMRYDFLDDYCGAVAVITYYLPCLCQCFPSCSLQFNRKTVNRSCIIIQYLNCTLDIHTELIILTQSFTTPPAVGGKPISGRANKHTYKIKVITSIVYIIYQNFIRILKFECIFRLFDTLFPT